LPPLVLQQTFATRIQALKAAHRAALAQLDALSALQQRAFAVELKSKYKRFFAFAAQKIA
jgi:hypothetical protein